MTITVYLRLLMCLFSTNISSNYIVLCQFEMRSVSYFCFGMWCLWYTIISLFYCKNLRENKFASEVMLILW